MFMYSYIHTQMHTYFRTCVDTYMHTYKPTYLRTDVRAYKAFANYDSCFPWRLDQTKAIPY